MPTSNLHDVSASGVLNNPRLEALRAKHKALSREIENAQKTHAVTDYYLKQLKKQRLATKEKLVTVEKQVVSS